MKSRIAAAAAFAICCACAGVEGPDLHSKHYESAAAHAFERLQKLEGEWTGTMTWGSESGPAIVDYRVVAGGSAVVETFHDGERVTMMTVYHMDLGRLRMTHFCDAGNQPRMVFVSDSHASEHPAADMVRFEFADATNMASRDDAHMHSMSFWLDGADHIESRWTYFENGRPAGDAVMDLHRKQMEWIELQLVDPIDEL